MRRRDPEDPSATHVIARVSLGLFVVLLFAAALALAVMWRADELALERGMENAVKSWLWP